MGVQSGNSSGREAGNCCFPRYCQHPYEGFYDLHILNQLHGHSISAADLSAALIATATKRGTEKYLANAMEVCDEVEK